MEQKDSEEVHFFHRINRLAYKNRNHTTRDDIKTGTARRWRRSNPESL
jgi:hypothetical protein